MSKSPFLILFLAVLCLCSSICAQEPIDTYEDELMEHTLADLNMKGPVKTATVTLFIKSKGDSIFHQKMKTILNFDTIGRLVTKTVNWGTFEDKDSIVEYFQYDSLNRLSVCFSSDSPFRSDFIYDGNGNFSHCIYTRKDEQPKSSFRYYYDEKGRCTRREYIAGIDEEYLGYKIYQHFFQYDSLDHCIEKVTMLDGDTESVKRLKYDIRGNITERIIYDAIGGGVENLSQELFFYDDEDRVVKSQFFFDHSAEDESFYEYNEQNQLIRKKTYKIKEGIKVNHWSFLDEMFYDQYGNCVENISSSILQDRSPRAVMKATYEYEYADE